MKKQITMFVTKAVAGSSLILFLCGMNAWAMQKKVSGTGNFESCVFVEVEGCTDDKGNEWFCTEENSPKEDCSPNNMLAKPPKKSPKTHSLGVRPFKGESSNSPLRNGKSD